MARPHVPCEVKGCREPAAWIVWSLHVLPSALCDRSAWKTIGIMHAAGQPALALPLVFSLS